MVSSGGLLRSGALLPWPSILSLLENLLGVWSSSTEAYWAASLGLGAWKYVFDTLPACGCLKAAAQTTELISGPASFMYDSLPTSCFNQWICLVCKQIKRAAHCGKEMTIGSSNSAHRDKTLSHCLCPCSLYFLLQRSINIFVKLVFFFITQMTVGRVKQSLYEKRLSFSGQLFSSSFSLYKIGMKLGDSTHLINFWTF